MISYKRRVLLCYLGGALAGFVTIVIIMFTEPASESRLGILLDLPEVVVISTIFGGGFMHLRLAFRATMNRIEKTPSRETVKHEKEIRELEDSICADLLENAMQIQSSTVVVADTSPSDPELMRRLIEQIHNKVTLSAVLLVSARRRGKVVLVAGISPGLVEQGASAGNWIREVAPVVGGGRWKSIFG